jgi:pyruvate/2-oxoglutarate dehydrogenase complex dihydrolipoamide acyltransferase (E2) component
MLTRYPLTLPNLGLGDRVVTASAWLVELGARVLAGDRVLEVLCGSVTIDLPAPSAGVLVEMLVEEDEPLTIGQTLAIVESSADG